MARGRNGLVLAEVKRNLPIGLGPGTEVRNGMLVLTKGDVAGTIAPGITTKSGHLFCGDDMPIVGVLRLLQVFEGYYARRLSLNEDGRVSQFTAFSRVMRGEVPPFSTEIAKEIGVSTRKIERVFKRPLTRPMVRTLLSCLEVGGAQSLQAYIIESDLDNDTLQGLHWLGILAIPPPFSN